MQIGIGLAINNGQRASSFDPTSLPGAVGIWPLTEGSGRAINRVPASRTIVNLIPSPENSFATGFWSPTAATVTDAYATNEPGTFTTASRVVINAAAGGYIQANSGYLSTPAGTYTLSLYVRSNTGLSQNIRLAGGTFANVSSDLAVTTSWTRVSFTWTAGSTVTQVWVRQDAASAATDIVIWGMQLELAGSPTTYQAPQIDIHPTTWDSNGIVGAGSTFAIMPCPNPTSYANVTGYALIKQTSMNGSYGILIASAASGGYANFGFSASSTSFYPGMLYAGSLSPVTGNARPQKFVTTNDGLWHVMAWKYDGTTFRYYIDGTEFNFGASTRSAQTVNNLIMGSGGVGFRGTVAYMALYNSAHSLAQIRTMSDYIKAQGVAKGLSFSSTNEWVVFFGDSLTGNTDSWSETVATNLALAGRQFRNDGIGGSWISGGTNQADPARKNYLIETLSPTKTKAVIVVAFGTNDYANVSAVAYYNSLKSMCQDLVTAGFRVAVATNVAGGSTVGSAINVGRATNNPLIISNAVSEGWANAVIDFAADANMNDNTNPTTAPNTYYGDNLHPTAAGYALMAPYAQTAVTALLA
jgi:lysophospholipase L1-like esterase